MKKFLFLFLIITITSVFFSSCWINETGPQIDTTTQVGGTFQQHRVMIEDITGVRCTNCPDGHDLAKTISQNYPGRVEVICIHSGIYAVPYSYSHYDFKADCPEGVSIDNWIGPSSTWPTADIDRKLFTGESALFLSMTTWAGYVAQELATDTPVVAITINKNYNDANRQLDVSLNLQYNKTETGTNHFTIYLVEDSIVDPQSNDNLPPPSIDTFYHHMNVLRHVLTAYNGDLISGDKSAGKQIGTANYSFTLPANIDPNHARVVAFVSEYGSSKEVLQVVSKSVK